MGTRADFYVGIGQDAEWIGSDAYSGYPGAEAGGVPNAILKAKTEKAFRRAVARRIDQPHGTKPEQGWPWPWENSRTTDYAYAWHDGGVMISPHGHPWIPIVEYENLEADETAEEAYYAQDRTADVPDMTSKRNVTIGPRSGLLLGKPF